MDSLTLDVESVVAGGNGLARDPEGRVVFVTGGLPGERVEVQVREAKRDFSRADVVRVLEPSPHRVDPPCPHIAAGCGGCDWLHISPAGQRPLKASIVADALRRQARIDIEVAHGPDLPPTGHRTTLRGQAAGGRFGLRRRASHDLVAVDPCLVAHPLVAELIMEGRFPDGLVVLRAGANTGERLVLVGGDAAEVSVPEGVRVVSERELRSGRRSWFHEELAGRTWRISARSFFQARPDGAEALVELVRDAVGQPDPEGHLVDLYGGVGLFAGALGDEWGHVTLVEQGASSVADARVNLADVPAKVVKVDVDRWRPSPASAVVADPPRAGLGAKGVASAAGTGAPVIVLVSCDPASLARDARLLAGEGYDIAGSTLVDLFPGTSHVEVVTRFRAR